MNIRPYRPGDAAGLLSMWNASARFDPLTPALLEEKVHGDGGLDSGMAFVCDEDGGITGFAMGVLREAGDGPLGFVKLIAVVPDRRRQGAGSRLLGIVEKALFQRGARTVRPCESSPDYLVPGVDRRYGSAPCFLEAHGYRRVGEACNMTVDLEGREFTAAGEEKILAARGIELRRAEASDDASLAELLDAHWTSWKAEAGVALRNDPPSLHLALLGGRVVGFAAWDANNRGTGWFGPMGTAPEARGGGVGRLLLLRCLEDIRLAGHRRATIPWVGPVRFYEASAGAVVSRVFDRYEKEFAP